MSADPIGIEDGVNVYRYTGNNPIMLLDPSGRQASSNDEIIFSADTIIGNLPPKQPICEPTNESLSPEKANIDKGAQQSKELDSSESVSFFDRIGSAFGDIWNSIKGAASKAWDWTKSASMWTWNWILAPTIRTATNVAAGILVGALVGAFVGVFAGAIAGGALVGAIAGGIIGAISGPVHGWKMAEAETYDWKSASGWGAFLVDNTWSAINSFAGSIWATVNINKTIDSKRSKGTGELVFKEDAVEGYATTFGNVITGLHVPKHESVHVLQARLFGPTYLPITGANYLINTLIPWWLIEHSCDYEKRTHKFTPGTVIQTGINDAGQYFSRGVYPHTLFEMWAYSKEGAPY